MSMNSTVSVFWIAFLDSDLDWIFCPQHSIDILWQMETIIMDTDYSAGSQDGGGQNLLIGTPTSRTCKTRQLYNLRLTGRLCTSIARPQEMELDLFLLFHRVQDLLLEYWLGLSLAEPENDSYTTCSWQEDHCTFITGSQEMELDILLLFHRAPWCSLFEFIIWDPH